MGNSVGTLSIAAGQKQHVDLPRKLGQRRRLLELVAPGAAYVPFCGDGDIAAEVYADREVWAADLDPARVNVAEGRLSGRVVVADCNEWPFDGETTPAFAVADLDSYAYPYHAFRAWWTNAAKCDTVAVFFTDGQPQAIHCTSKWTTPQGDKATFADLNEMRRTYNAYWSKTVRPWLDDVCGTEWQVVKTEKYLRAGNMLYWGCVLSRTSSQTAVAAVDDVGRQRDEVLKSLYEAAVSGNVPAQTLWLQIHDGAESDTMSAVVDQVATMNGWMDDA